MLKLLIGPITDLAGSFLKNKAEEKQAKHEAKINVIKNDADWEAKMADASKDSWKDEFWTLVLALPIFLICWGIAVDDITVLNNVKKAFVVLESLPEWYQGLLVLAVTAAFGRKGLQGYKKYMGMRK